jgi:hypothetical protein
MMTNNLQEMIQQKPHDAFEYADFDQNDTMPDKKDDLTTGIIASEASILPIKLPEIQDSNYQPETEEALIDYIVSQNNKLEVATIFVKWEIGRSINSFYKGKHGDRELEKISQQTGIGKDSLHKMIKFAKEYTLEHIKTLIKGKFALSWNGILQNLSVNPDVLIKVYESVNDISAFHKAIISFKSPAEKRGKSRSAQRNNGSEALNVEKPEQLNVPSTEITVSLIPEQVAEKPVIAAPEIIQDESIPAENHDDQKGSNDKITQEYSKELESLRIENQQLREEVAEKNRQIDSLSSMMKEDERDIKDKDLLLAAYRDRFKRLRFMIDNNFSIGNIMELLAAVE